MRKGERERESMEKDQHHHYNVYVDDEGLEEEDAKEWQPEEEEEVKIERRDNQYYEDGEEDEGGAATAAAENKPLLFATTDSKSSNGGHVNGSSSTNGSRKPLALQQSSQPRSTSTSLLEDSMPFWRFSTRSLPPNHTFEEEEKKNKKKDLKRKLTHLLFGCICALVIITTIIFTAIFMPCAIPSEVIQSKLYNFTDFNNQNFRNIEVRPYGDTYFSFSSNETVPFNSFMIQPTFRGPHDSSFEYTQWNVVEEGGHTFIFSWSHDRYWWEIGRCEGEDVTVYLPFYINGFISLTGTGEGDLYFSESLPAGIQILNFIYKVNHGNSYIENLVNPRIIDDEPISIIRLTSGYFPGRHYLNTVESAALSISAIEKISLINVIVAQLFLFSVETLNYPTQLEMKDVFLTSFKDGRNCHLTVRRMGVTLIQSLTFPETDCIATILDGQDSITLNLLNFHGNFNVETTLASGKLMVDGYPQCDDRQSCSGTYDLDVITGYAHNITISVSGDIMLRFVSS